MEENNLEQLIEAEIPTLNSKQRRMRINNRNLVSQNIPLFDNVGNPSGFKKIYHLKQSNLPRTK